MLKQRAHRRWAGWRRRLAAVVVAGALALGTGSCTGGGGSGSPTPSPTSPTAPTDTAAALVKFNACLREHGVKVPDSGPAVARGEEEDPNFAAAAGRCKQHLAGTSIEVGTGGGGGHVSEEQLKSLLAYAGCMRGKGIDMPDPDPDSGAVAPKGSSGLDQESEEFRNAHAACRGHLNDAEVADGGAS